jgi:hypothetical protein
MTDKETERRLLDEHKMATEMQRVRTLLQAATEACAAEGGDIRFFNAALMTAAIQLHSEVEGADTVERAITAVAKRHLIRTRKAGRC